LEPIEGQQLPNTNGHPCGCPFCIKRLPIRAADREDSRLSPMTPTTTPAAMARHFRMLFMRPSPFVLPATLHRRPHGRGARGHACKRSDCYWQCHTILAPRHTTESRTAAAPNARHADPPAQRGPVAIGVATGPRRVVLCTSRAILSGRGGRGGGRPAMR
jgi:hypothetical protein